MCIQHFFIEAVFEKKYDATIVLQFPPSFLKQKCHQMAPSSGELEKNLKTVKCSRQGARSFTSLKADLRQDINGGFAFSRFLNGTFPW